MPRQTTGFKTTSSLAVRTPLRMRNDRLFTLEDLRSRFGAVGGAGKSAAQAVAEQRILLAEVSACASRHFRFR